MSFLYSLIGFLIAIGVLVAVHEFGHFWVARKLGVKVLRFSIGFGKPLWKKTHGIDQTEYVIAAIPLGGYVKMLGERDPEVPINPAEAHRAFDNQPIWKRSLIVAAGPGINFLFAIILFAIIGAQSSEELTPTLGELPPTSVVAQAGGQSGDRILAIDGQRLDYFRQHDLYIFNRVLQGENIEIEVEGQTGIRTLMLDVSNIPIYNINPGFITRTLGLVPVFPEISNQLSQIVPESAADRAGFQVGDSVTEVDGKPVASWSELVKLISASPERAMLFTVERGTSTLRIEATPDAVETGEQKIGRLGVAPSILPYEPQHLTMVDRSLFEATLLGARQTWLMSVVTLRMLWKMVTLQVSPKNISGPITIADYAGQAIQISANSYLYILAVISISLGVMNLLPIPMLDGGHLLMYAIEIVAGKNIAEQAFAVGQRLGIVMLLCLMSLAFYNDIFRLLN